MNKEMICHKAAAGQRQRGFGMLSVLIGTVVLLGVTVAVVATTRGSIVTRDLSAAHASAVISQANALLTAYETGVSRGGFTDSTLEFNSDKLYSPSITGLSELPLLPQAFDEVTWKEVRWQFGRATAIKGFGTDTGAERAFYLPGVSQSVCAAVNKAMTGSTVMDTAADTANTLPPNAATVTTLTSLFNSGSDTFPADIKTSKLQPAAPSPVPTLTIQNNASPAVAVKAPGSIGCFKIATPSVHVVYAIAQAN